MVRTVRIFLILMLVAGTIFVTESSEEIPFSLTENVSASENVTWDMMNQTVDDLKSWFETVYLDKINLSISAMDTTIQGYLDELNNSIYLSLMEMADKMNFTVEEYNETTLMGRIANIESALGYFNTSASVYDDLSAVLAGLVDKDGGYILRNASGVSSFYLMGEMMLTLNANQGVILDQIEIDGNISRGVMTGGFNDLEDNAETNAKWTAQNAGSEGLLSGIAAVGVIFILLWILFLKKYLAEHFGIGAIPMSNEEQEEYEEERNQRRESSAPLFSKNPLKNRDEPPGCYCDGVTYNPHEEPACDMCPYKEQCSSTKMEFEARQQLQQQVDQTAIGTPEGVDLSSVGIEIPTIDLEKL